ncbi:hypothetical protein EU538_05440 [Candidatus Thorarchaeota archaeon]|nr:MAG: hypothetical protein EU538_05440 [Candidatus Thorarchaeota archaeon]
MMSFTMSLLDRLLNLFGRGSGTLLGAISHPSDLLDLVYQVRNQTYQRITGKNIPSFYVPRPKQRQEESTNLSHLRRLVRK